MPWSPSSAPGPMAGNGVASCPLRLSTLSIGSFSECEPLCSGGCRPIPGANRPHLGHVVAVVVAVNPQQVGFFGAAYGYLDRHNEDHEDRDRNGVGGQQASRPSVNTTIAAKIGLRTRLNVPVRTSVVVSVVSMPTRQDSPMSSCSIDCGAEAARGQR